jgi:hypothetical protein
LIKARVAVKTITKKVDGAFSKKLTKKVGAIKAKLAGAKHPERRAALKVQLKIANKIFALKKKYAAAPEAKKPAIRAKIMAVKAKLVAATKRTQ